MASETHASRLEAAAHKRVTIPLAGPFSDHQVAPGNRPRVWRGAASHNPGVSEGQMPTGQTTEALRP